MHRYRNFWLLLSLIGLVISAPIAEQADLSFIVHATVSAVVIVLIINVVVDNPSHRWVAVALAALWLAVTLSWWLVPTWHVVALSDLVFTCLVVFIIYDILIVLMNVQESDFNLLSAAISVYLLIAVAWGISFDLIELLWPGSYTIPTAMIGEGHPTASQFLYFSLTTLTTLGYGDMTPATPLAGIWATLEAVAGIVYTAILVARLVSLLRR